MKPSTILAAAALTAAPVAAQVPEGDFAQILPRDTMVLAQVHDLSRGALLDPDGAMMRLFEHEAVRAAFEGAFDMLDTLEDEEFLLGLDLEKDEIGRLFNGRVVFAIPEIVIEENEVAIGSTSRVQLELDLPRGVVAMADFDGTADRLEQLLENATKLIEEQPDVHRAGLFSYDEDGVRLFNIEEVSDDLEVTGSMWMALVDDVLMFSDEEDTLIDFADLGDKGAPEGDRLVDDPRYLDTLDRVGRHDALLYFNTGEFLPLINELIEHELKQRGPAVEMFLRVDDLISTLRLEAVESFFASVYVDDDEAGMTYGMTFADTDEGLHRMLAYSDRGVEIPEYFSSDFHTASISLFDLSAAYDVFDEMLMKISPVAHGMFESEIEKIEADSFPLRDALLRNLEGRVVSMLGYPEATVAGPDDYPSTAYVIRVADPQTLNDAMGLMTQDITTEDPVEFMNETIWTIPLGMQMAPGQPPADLSLAIVQSDVIVALGDPKMVENVIAHIKNPGESLLDDEDLIAAFDDMPDEDVVELGFVDIADLLENTIRGGDSALAAQIMLGQSEDDLEMLLEAQQKLDELPDVSDIQYFLVTKGYRADDAYVLRSLLRPNLDG